MRLTVHAKDRSEERFGLTKTKEIKREFRLALRKGTPVDNLPDCEARDFLLPKKRHNKKVMIYNQKVFIYHNQTTPKLITVYKLTKSLEKRKKANQKKK